MRAAPLVWIAVALALVALWALAGSREPELGPAPPAGQAPEAAARSPEPVPQAEPRAALESLPDAFGPTRDGLTARTDGLRPEVVPAAALLWAVAAADLETLRALYAPRAARQIDHVGWERHLQMSDALFFRRLGPHDLGAFRFEFDGAGDAGTVTVRRDGRALAPLRVVRSDGRWLLADP